MWAEVKIVINYNILSIGCLLLMLIVVAMVMSGVYTFLLGRNTTGG